MARSLNGTSQRFSSTTPFLTQAVSTLAVRVKMSSLAGSAMLVWYGDKTTRYDCNQLHFDVTSGQFWAGTIAAGPTSAYAKCLTAIDTSTIYSVVGVFAASNDRKIYVNQDAVASDTTNIALTTGNMNYSMVGARFYEFVTTDLFLPASLIQDVAIWDVALTANEAKAFNAGVSPLLIRPASLKHWFPMLNSETSGGNTTSLVGTRMALTQSNSPPLVNPAPTAFSLTPRFRLAAFLGGGGNTTAAGSSAGTGAANGIGASLARAYGSSDGVATATGYSSAGTFGISEGSATAEATSVSIAVAVGSSSGLATVRGRAPATGDGRLAIIRSVTQNVIMAVTRGVTGGLEAANPSPPAGDAIQLLLNSMSSGQIKRLNDRTYNMKTGPEFVRGYTAQGKSLYSRDLYDYGYMQYGSAAALWANDAACIDDLTGATHGGGSVTDDRGRLIYCGMGYSFSRNLAILMGGGHTSGAMNHAIAFDVAAACQDILDGGSGGIWDQFSDPAPYGRPQSLSAGEGGIYPPYGRDSNWPALSDPYDTKAYPQPIDTAVWPAWYNPIAPGDNNGDCPPYALHSGQAIEYDDVNDQLWACGYIVALGNNGSLNSSSAGGTCVLDYTTRQWTRKTGTGLGGLGGGGPYFHMAPNAANYMLVRKFAYQMGLYDIANGTTANAGRDDGDSNDIALGGITLVEDIHTVGQFGAVFFVGAGSTIAIDPKVYPGGGATVSRFTKTSGDLTGVTKVFDVTFGMACRTVDGKIYVAGYDALDSNTFKVQTLDPFQGNPTGQATWEVANVSLSGDTVTAASGTAREFYNRFRYLPDYDAFVFVTGFSYGDVYLMKA